MVFFGSFLTLMPAKKAEAMTPMNVMLLTKIVRGIGEKIGINWSSPALQATVGYLAGKAEFDLDGGEPVAPFWQLFGTTPDTLPIDDGDYKKYSLSPDDFKKGVELIKESENVIVPDSIIPIFGNCSSDKSVGTTPIMGDGINYLNYSYTGIGLFVFTFSNPSADITFDGADFHGTNLGGYTNYKSTDGGNTYSYYNSGGSTVTGSYTGLIGFSKSGVSCDYKVKTDDIVNISNVNNVWNNTTNNYNYYNNYTIITNAAGDGTEAVDVPVNPPFTPAEVGDITAPPIPDTDNDGIPDPTDITPGGETPTPDDTGIFAKLFPILLIVKLFGVLGSCLMYLIRMFQFIMTIPGIDAIPIDNTAFVWFRSTQIIGIKIYDVVSSLAGVGLSFIVFRAIRRAFL
jgi:hypothetical protein